MKNVHTLVLGDYRTNCYVLWQESSHSCVVIDPGYEPQAVLDFLESQGLSCAAILLTHGHFDHVGAVEAMEKATGCALWMSERDYSQVPILKPLYPLCNRVSPETHFFEDGEILQLAGLEIHILETPGHTQGSVCFRIGDALFTGDTLFAGSCGRTDLPGGSRRAILESLGRLKALEGNYTVYPGHGSVSDLSTEKEFNPYMR